MAIEVTRGQSDKVIERMIKAIDKYQEDHPKAQIGLYRQNSVSVRVRIIDPDFSALKRVKRSTEVWKYLDTLPDKVQADLSSLTLITPEEKAESFGSFIFKNPSQSQL